MIEDVEGFQQSQIPYKGIWATQNIKYWFQGKNLGTIKNDRYNLRSRDKCKNN